MLQKKKEKKEKKKKINDFPGNWKKQKGEGTHFHLPEEHGEHPEAEQDGKDQVGLVPEWGGLQFRKKKKKKKERGNNSQS